MGRFFWEGGFLKDYFTERGPQCDGLMGTQLSPLATGLMEGISFGGEAPSCLASSSLIAKKLDRILYMSIPPQKKPDGKICNGNFFLYEKKGRNGTNKIDIAGAEVHEQKVLMSFTLKSSFSGI